MDEQEWMNATGPYELLKYLRGKVSDRKLRLFACACCRRVWQLLIKESRKAVEVAERFADGLIPLNELNRARKDTGLVFPNGYCDNGASYVANRSMKRWAPLVAWATRAGSGKDADVEDRAQAAELRHIIGNPFRLYQPPASWPSSVVQLTQSLYQGENVASALADALEEAGHVELAQHFRSESGHPKGCWAMDVVLGKS